MAYRIIRSDRDHETDEPKRYETEETAIRAIQQVIYAAETEGGAGGPPDKEIRTGGLVWVAM